MKTLVYKIMNAADPLLDEISRILRNGGVAALPTETVYGLAANALDPKAASRIYQVKGRPSDNPLIVHIAGLCELDLYCRDIPESARRLCETFWPGPLTLVLKSNGRIPPEITAGLDTLAVRCPDNAITLEIIRRAGVPLAAPSANISGKPSPTRAMHVLADLDGKIDAVIDGGECRVGLESTIIDLTGDKPRLLRPGGITAGQIESLIGPIEIDPAVTGTLDEGETVHAPGMKYRHYSPTAPVYIVGGDAETAAAFINSHGGPGAAVLCFEEEAAYYQNMQAASYGLAAEPETLAHGLFDALRSLDRPDITVIYARCPEGGGIERAIANRLGKASGFHFIDPDSKQGEKANMQIIGLTGGSGSGKTSVLKLLEADGAYIIDCDALYHELLENSQELIAQITKRFPDAAADGAIDRKALGGIVFSDKAALNSLNSITHSFVMREVQGKLNAAEKAGYELAAIDAIALIESGLGELCEFVIGVVAPQELRVSRLTLREGISEEYARLRISAQKPDRFFIENCDFIINNDTGDLNDLKRRWNETFKQIKQ